MKRLLTALVVLTLLYPCTTGCGPAPLCRTRCGLELEWLPPEADPSWTCDNLQRTEDQVLESFRSVLDPRFAETCQRVANEGIYVVGANSWKDSGERSVAGQTFCASGYLYVYKAEPWNIALPHEMAHVVQGCWPRGPYPTDGGSLEHANWDRDGIHAAVQDVKNHFLDAGIP
jgi:hypothetical protein